MIELLAAILLFGIAIVWFGLPFVPTMLELRRRTEARPLAVDRENDGEIRHFARRFKAYLESNFPNRSLAECINGGSALEGQFHDGTPYRVVGKEDDSLADAARTSGSVPAIMVFSGRAVLPGGLKFPHGIYAADDVECGSRTLIRSLYAERDARLLERTVVLRWLHVEKELLVGDACALYGRASAEQAMRIGHRVEFERLHSPRIYFENGKPFSPPYTAVFTSLHRGQVQATEMTANCYAVDKDLEVPDETLLFGNFVVRGKVKIGRAARVEGSIKSHGDMRIEDGAFVDGSVISSGDLDIGSSAVVRGPAVASRKMTIRSGGQIGVEHRLTSAIAPTILVDPGVLVFGTLWARDHGRVGG